MATNNDVLLEVKISGQNSLEQLDKMLKRTDVSGKELQTTLNQLKQRMLDTQSACNSLTKETTEYSSALREAKKAADDFNSANIKIGSNINTLGNIDFGTNLVSSFSAVEAVLNGIGQETSKVTNHLLNLTNVLQSNSATSSITATQAALNAMRQNIQGVTSASVVMNDTLGQTGLSVDEITKDEGFNNILRYSKEELDLISQIVLGTKTWDEVLDDIEYEISIQEEKLDEISNTIGEGTTAYLNQQQVVEQLTATEAGLRQVMDDEFTSVEGLKNINNQLVAARNSLNQSDEDAIETANQYTQAIGINNGKLRELTTTTQVGSGSITEMKNALNGLRALFDALPESERNAEVAIFNLGKAQNATAEQVEASNNSLLGQINKLNSQIKETNVLAGRSTSSFNGLSMAISQVAREMPNFMYSAQIGFMAISNNLPILVDEIKRAQSAGESMGKAFKTALGGMNGAVLAFVALSSLIPKIYEEIVEYINKIPTEIQIAIDLETDSLKKTEDLRVKISKFQSDYAKAQKEHNSAQLKYLSTYATKEFGIHKDKLAQIMETEKAQKAYFDSYLKMAEATYYNEAIMKKKAEQEIIVESNLAQVKLSASSEDITAKRLDQLYKLASYSGAQAVAADTFLVGVEQQIVDLLRERIKAGITLSKMPAYKDADYQLKETKTTTTTTKDTTKKEKITNTELPTYLTSESVELAKFNQAEIDAINEALINSENKKNKTISDIKTLSLLGETQRLYKQIEIANSMVHSYEMEANAKRKQVSEMEENYHKEVRDLNTKISSTNSLLKTETDTYNSYEAIRADIINRINILNNQFTAATTKEAKDRINVQLAELNEQKNINDRNIKNSKAALDDLKGQKKELEDSLKDVSKTPDEIAKVKDQIEDLDEKIADGAINLASLHKEAFSSMMADVQAYLGAASSMTDAMANYYGAQMDEADAYYDANAQLIENSNMAEDEKTEALDKNEQERYEVKKELFEKQKKWEEASAWINFASGSVGAWAQALATLPPIVAPIVAGVETAALLVTTLANVKSIRAQKIDAPSPSAGSSSSSGSTTNTISMTTALNPSKTSLTSSEENIGTISNSSNSKTETVVRVSDINKVQNTVKVRDNNTSY